MPRQAARGESGAEGESHQRTEAVGGREAHIVQTRYGAFEIAVENRRSFHGPGLLQQRAIEERQATDFGPIPGRGDDVLEFPRATAAGLPVEPYSHASIARLHIRYHGAQV